MERELVQILGIFQDASSSRGFCGILYGFQWRFGMFKVFTESFKNTRKRIYRFCRISVVIESLRGFFPNLNWKGVQQFLLEMLLWLWLNMIRDSSSLAEIAETGKDRSTFLTSSSFWGLLNSIERNWDDLPTSCREIRVFEGDPVTAVLPKWRHCCCGCSPLRIPGRSGASDISSDWLCASRSTDRLPPTNGTKTNINHWIKLWIRVLLTYW